MCGMDHIAATAIFLFYSTSPFVFLQYDLESPHVAFANIISSSYQVSHSPVSTMLSVAAMGN